MSKLIEKEGKFYKECGVVMLDYKKASPIALEEGGRLKYIGTMKDGYIPTSTQYTKHLYITSDDEIKEGDKVLIFNNEGNIKIFSPKICNTVAKSINLSNKDSDPTQHKYKKIIATTDKLCIGHEDDYDERSKTGGNPIWLPQPSDKFIQAYIDAYNKGEKIEKVLVEYEKSKECNCHNYKSCESFRLPVEVHCSRFEPKYFLRLKNNNIIIKKIKDSWNREEVEQLLFDLGADLYHKRIGNGLGSIEKWIEENL